jgi:uncharacterized membrane protein
MTNMTIWKFDNADAAQQSLEKFASLQKEHLVTVVDAATVSWPKGKSRPTTRQAVSSIATGSLDGAFWGMLFGLIFFVPFFGAAVGAAWGALAGGLKEYGVDGDLIANVRAQVKEGTSALFLLTTNEVPDRLAEVFRGTHMKLIQSNLSRDQESRLREMFAT